MKVSASSFPAVETPSPAVSAKGGNDFGQVFESAVRNAEKESSSKRAARDETASADGDRRDAKGAEDDALAHAKGKTRAETRTEKLALHRKNDGASDRGAAETRADEETTDGGPADGESGVALLGRLLGAEFGAGVAAQLGASAGKAGDTAGEASETAEIVLEERVVVISLEPGATEESLAGQARGKVTLEVLRMETHFEPRSDAVVLVEGKSPGNAGGEGGIAAKTTDKGVATEGAAAETALAGLDARDVVPQPKARADEEGGKLRLSFDEALARLGKGEARGQAETGSGDGRHAREDGAAGRPATADADEASRHEPAGRTAKAAETPVRGVAGQPPKADAERTTPRGATAPGSAAVDVDAPVSAFPIASMTDQVAVRIIDSLGPVSSAALASDRPAGDSVLRFTAGGAALKTLTIQLQPENLGVLDVSMRLVDGQLTLELAASEASTARVLAEDREGLRKLLQHAGFSVDEASITIVTRDAAGQTRIDAAASASATRQDGGSSEGGRADGGAGERESRQPDGGRQDAERRGNGRSAPDDSRKSPARSASTYI